MTRFVVLTTQRSGSTLLCSALDRIPGVRCLTGCCRIPCRISDRSGYQFLHFLHDAGLNFDALSSAERAVYVGMFLDAVTREQPGRKAAGFKLMYEHYEQIPEVLSWLQDRSVRVIHLIRENKLKRLLSNIIYAHTGMSRSEDRPSHQGRVRLCCDGLIALLHDMEAQVQDYRRLFSNQLPYLEVVYEDFVRLRTREANRLGRFLGLGLLGRLESAFVKMNSDSVRDVVVNYEEVAQTLQGSSFAHFLV